MAHKSNNEGRGFTAREARALLWLLPALAVVAWLAWMITTTADFGHAETEKNISPANFGRSGEDGRLATVSNEEHAETYASDSVSGLTEAGATPSPRFFDPNTVEYHDLVRLGFTRGEALGIIKYRERGKVFEIPEDFAACHQVSEAMYMRLKPYIRIGEKYRLKPFAQTESRSAGRREAYNDRETNGEQTVMEPEFLILGGGPEPIAPLILTDLNTADSAALIAVSGIGPGTVGRIMEYRTRLGGFVDVRQLAEVRGVTEQNYERIIEQIFVDPAAIQKIDINFAAAKILAAHPYVRAEALRKLLKKRQLKGGWRSIEELENDDIFTAEELEKLGHYLIFN